MFGKKKKPKKADKEVKEIKEPEPTEVIEAGTSEPEPTEPEESKERKLPKDTRYILDQFQKDYNGLVVPQDFYERSPAPMQTNLLLAIYGELRLLRKREEGVDKTK